MQTVSHAIHFPQIYSHKFNDIMLKLFKVVATSLLDPVNEIRLPHGRSFTLHFAFELPSGNSPIVHTLYMVYFNVPAINVVNYILETVAPSTFTSFEGT